MNEEFITHAADCASIAAAMWLPVMAAVLLDMWDGVYTARCLGQKIHSHRLRTTVAKMCEYWRLMAVGLTVDLVAQLLPFYSLPYVSMIAGVGLIAIEAKSMVEHTVRRKSQTVALRDFAKMAVDCASEGDALKMLKKFADFVADGGKEAGYEKV